MPTTELDVWQWRIYVPKETRVDMGNVTKEIPPMGTPKPSITGAFIESNPNGTLVTAAIRKSVGEGYDLILNLGHGTLCSLREHRELIS